MKKFKLTKIITCSLIVTSILALNPIGANAEWKQDNNGWWYENSDSYYTGWKNVDGKWYFFNSDGYMVHDTTIDGYQLGSDGAWIREIVLATIGDEKITKDDLDKEMKFEDAYLKGQLGNDYTTNANVKDQLTQYKKQELEDMVVKKTILKKASELNVKPTDEDVNKQMTDSINNYNSQHTEENYADTLKKMGMTEAEAKENLRDLMTISATEDYVTKDITVTDDEAQRYYDDNKSSKFTINAGANVAHILVKDEVTAKKLKEQLDAGADFATLAKENSIDTGSKNNGGDLGFIPYNSTEYVSEFMDGFKNLKEGQVSDPVKSEFGYHLIKVTGIKEGQVISFDEVKDKVKAGILKAKKGAAFADKINEWKSELNVKIYTDEI